MKNFLILVLVAGFSYIIGASHNKPQSNENSRYIAIATRMIFAQQCSETIDQYFGKSSDSMMMSKEHIQMSNICYTVGDQISKEIENVENINEDNIVEVIDKAMGKVKKDLAKSNNEESETPSELENLDLHQDNFI